MGESEILIRRLDRYLAGLRPSDDPADLAVAGRLAEALRRVVAETASASAADRARVRAAVHYVVLRRARPIAEDVRVVNEILLLLDRPDLTIRLTPEPA